MLTEAMESVEGAHLVGLVGLDGIPVEVVNNDGDSDLEAREEMAVQLASLMGAVNRGANYLDGGAIKDVIIEAESRTFLASMLDDSYFLLIVLGSEGSMGRGRFELRQIMGRLRREV